MFMSSLQIFSAINKERNFLLRFHYFFPSHKSFSLSRTNNLAFIVDTGWKTRDNNFRKLSVRALISGEHPEAMQTGSCGKSQSYYVVISLMMLITVCNYIRKELFLLPSSSSSRWPNSNPSASPPNDAPSTVFLINFKLLSKEGVYTKIQEIQKSSIYAKSWLTKHFQQCTGKDAS